MLPASYQIWFAVFLAAIHCTLAEVIYRNHTSSHGIAENETRCSWNCTVTDSDLTEKVKTTMANGRSIPLLVKYEKEVNDKCVNKTSRNSSGNATEHWQIWLSNNNLSDNWMKTFLSTNLLSLLSGSHEERNEIRVVCTRTPSRTAATTHKDNTGVSVEDLKGVLAAFPWLGHEQPCNSEKDILESCINITKATGNNTDGRDYLSDVFVCLFGFITAYFVLYTPAFLCFFSPTLTKQDGVRQITLEGASPVSLNSLMGNFFFFKSDGTIWNKAITFIILIIALPLLYLPPAIASRMCEVKARSLFGVGNAGLFDLFLLVCYFYYVFEVFYISFLTERPIDGNPCNICRLFQPDNKICRDQDLPGQITHHLRQQPLILLTCCKLFLRHLRGYLRKCLSLILPFKFSFSSFFGIICLFPIFLLSIPLVAILLLTSLSLGAISALLLTCPVHIIFHCNIERGIRHVLLERFPSTLFSHVLRVVVIIFSFLPVFAVSVVLSRDAITILPILLWATRKLLSEETLPYIACFILVFYYLWSCYSSFTNKYQALALTLYKLHKKSPVVTDQEAGNAPIPGTVMKIPKELFDLACEQLMPIRVSVCILVLRVAIILAFVILVFFVIEDNHVSATPATRALLTFLSGLSPKIIEILIDGGKKNIEKTAIEEKAHYIIDDYNNRAIGQDVELINM